MSKKIYEERLEEIINKYKTGDYSCKDLGREYGITGSSLAKRMKSKGVEIIKKFPSKLKGHAGRRRKYSLNENFFDSIDSEEKAYFLGFLYADGCNHGESGCVEISLQEEDREILDRFRELVGSNRPLQLLKYHERKPTLKNQLRLNINSIKISKRLSQLGCIPAKSLILKFPTEDQIPKHLIRHFIRGYFDGDGSFCAYQNKNGYWSYGAGIVSSLIFCEELTKTLKELLNLKCYTHQSERHKKETATVVVNGIPNLNKFLTWIYEDSTIFLKRKKEKFEKNLVFFINIGQLGTLKKPLWTLSLFNQ